MSSSPAIVLDGNQKSALASVRAIGKLGHPVVVAEAERRCLAASSRYCSKTLVYPDPWARPDDFVDWLVGVDAGYSGSVLLPMTDVTVPLVLKNQESLPGLRTALPTLAAYEAVSDKYRLFELARAASVRVPETLVVSRRRLPTLAELHVPFPVVIKPRWSIVRTATVALQRRVSYASSMDELLARLNDMLIDDDDELLIQEYVKGSGAGVFGLYDHGSPLMFFAHRRVREKPPSGGISVLCESVALRERAVEAVRRILEPLDWHGVAMVEFKIDDDGNEWLIEVNARLWGSLQLAVDCGADFPALLYDIAAGRKPRTSGDYEVGRQLRSMIGDLGHLYLTLKDRRFTPTIGDKLTALGRFCVPWRPGLRYECLRLTDPLPAAFALGSSLRRLRTRRTTRFQER